MNPLIWSWPLLLSLAESASTNQLSARALLSGKLSTYPLWLFTGLSLFVVRVHRRGWVVLHRSREFHRSCSRQGELQQRVAGEKGKEGRVRRSERRSLLWDGVTRSSCNSHCIPFARTAWEHHFTSHTISELTFRITWTRSFQIYCNHKAYAQLIYQAG